ncbi:Arginine transport system permease protein ArtQ [Candidatus Izimaplasma bacterium HR1]|jgi:polar amino acid transport system permease protein|uniref:amino acid ABC transporter permease n=1 Tax=Candidatus Izimoplasma sp. HR1 TaxID=1541959 RepID=UPI0004F5CC6F|nr:Arginine transport system permease protein ArtQ [Candidatus Izimaplasma bacterium HR1]
MEKLFDYGRIKEWIPFLFNGLSITITIAIVAGIFGVTLGVILVIMSKNKITNSIAVAYIDIFRGTPLILQLSIIYFAIPQILDLVINGVIGMNVDFQLAGITAAFITFSLNSGAYISEIIRSGINSVDKGEIEAAKALGISKFHTYKDIILPIAFRKSFPSLMNEFITLVKESSIVSIIGIQDLMRRQQIVTSQTYMYFEPLIVIGIIYYVVIKILSFTGRKVEVKINYGRS